jgi:hypothetical protein
VFREHYKQLVPHWCVSSSADNFDRVTAKVQVGSRHRVPSGMQYDEPFTKEMERSRGPADMRRC